MRIMHVLAPADAGGLERVVHALAIGQHRRGGNVAVVPVVESWSEDHSFAQPLLRAGVSVIPVIVPPRAYRQERAAVAAALRDGHASVMHSHGYRSDVVCGGVARSVGVGTVSTAHGFTGGTWRNRLYEYIDCRALSRFDAVTAVSRPLGDRLVRAGVRPDRLHVIPNAWSSISPPMERAEARRELGLDPTAFVAGWVGRMTPEKGLDVFVDALLQLADLPVHACIVGDGPDRAPQVTRVTESPIANRVHWTGLVREAGRFFDAFDVLVLSSRTEGVPMVVLEAMARRIPLVVTAVGGIPDVVSAREALLVRSEQPDEIAAAMRNVFGDRHATADRVEAASKRLEESFAEGPWLDRYDEVYRKVARG